MAQGTVKKVVAEKGFGFISSENSDIFFHHSALVDCSIEALRQGQAVQFDVESNQGGKGPRAVNVKLVS